MADALSFYRRMDAPLKSNAENIPAKLPVAVGCISRNELDKELHKGITSIRNNAVYSADDVDAILKREFDV